MAGILVYLPGYSGQKDDAHLAAIGLGDLLDASVDSIFTACHAGPDGGRGTLVTFDNPVFPASTPRTFDANAQEWIDAPPEGELDRGRYWLGYVKGQKPTPGELQRPTLIDGEAVTLGDGQQWLIPISKFVPMRITRDRETGKEISVPKPEHREFIEWSNAMYDLFLSDGFQEKVSREHCAHIPRGLHYASMAMAKNYRVNADVVDLLGIFGAWEAFDIAWVASSAVLVSPAVLQKKSTASACLLPVES